MKNKDLLLLFQFVIALCIAIEIAGATIALQPLSPQPTPNAIYGIFVPPDQPGTAFMVGESGTILKYDSGLQEMNSPTNYPLRGIHGTSSTDIWAVGGTVYTDPDKDPSKKTVILHYDGVSWSEEEKAQFPTNMFDQYTVFNDVWADGAGNVYAVTENLGYIVKKTGDGAWVFVDLGDISLNFSLNTIYGFAPDDIYAAGSCGIILHYNGSTWAVERVENDDPYYCSEGMTFQFFNDIWGPDADNVYAVSGGGKILRRNPQTKKWDTLYSGGSWMGDYSKYAISATSPTDIVFMGAGGEMKRYDGNNLTTLDISDKSTTLCAVPWAGETTHLMGQTQGQIKILNGETEVAVSSPPVATNIAKVGRAERIWFTEFETLNPEHAVYAWDGKNIQSIKPKFSGQLFVNLFRVHSENDIVISGFPHSSSSTTKRYNGTEFVDDPEFNGQFLLDEVKKDGITAHIATTGFEGGAACVGDICTPDDIYTKLAIADDNKIYAIGENKQGVGSSVAVYHNGIWGDSTSTQVTLRSIAAGGGQICAGGDDRTIICKGDNGSWSTVSEGTTTHESLDSFTGIVYAGEDSFVAITNTNNMGSTSYIEDNTGEVYIITNNTISLLDGGIASLPGSQASMISDIASDGKGNFVLGGVGGIMMGSSIEPVTGKHNLAPVYMLLMD